MIIGNLRSFADLQKKKSLANDLLELEIANEAENQKRIRDYKSPYIAKPVPPVYKTQAEMRKDVNKLIKDASDKLLSLDLDLQVVQNVMRAFSSRGVDDLIKLNALFPSIKKDFRENINPMFATPESVIDRIDYTFSIASDAYGLKLGASSDLRSSAQLIENLDVIDDLAEFRGSAPFLSYASIFPERAPKVTQIITELIDALPSSDDFEKLNFVKSPVEKQKLLSRIQQVQRAYNIPSSEDLKRQLRFASNEDNPSKLAKILEQPFASITSQGISALKSFKDALAESEKTIEEEEELRQEKEFEKAIANERDVGQKAEASAIALVQGRFPNDDLNETIDFYLSETLQKFRGRLFKDSFDLAESILKNGLASQQSLAIKKSMEDRYDDKKDLYNQLGLVNSIVDIVTAKLGVTPSADQIIDLTRLQNFVDKLDEEAEVKGEDVEDVIIRLEEQGDKEFSDITQRLQKELIRFLNLSIGKYSFSKSKKIDIQQGILTKILQSKLDDLRDIADARYKAGDFNLDDAIDKIKVDIERETDTMLDLLLTSEGVSPDVRNLYLQELEGIEKIMKERIDSLASKELLIKRIKIEQGLSGVKPPPELPPPTYEEVVSESPAEIRARVKREKAEKKARDKEQLKEAGTEGKKQVLEQRRDERKQKADKDFEDFSADIEARYRENPLEATVLVFRIFAKAKDIVEKGISKLPQTFDKETILQSFSEFKSDVVNKNMVIDMEDLRNFLYLAQLAFIVLYHTSSENIEEQYIRKPNTKITGGVSGAKNERIINKDGKEVMVGDVLKLTKGLGLKKKGKGLKIEVDSDSDSDDEKKKKKGKGFNPRRVKIGGGVVAKEEPTYRQFGKFVIHMPQLHANRANFKYKSLGAIPSIKPVEIGQDYKDFLVDIMRSGVMNEKDYKRLGDKEKKHFEKVVLGSGLAGYFKIEKTNDEGDKKDLERFEVLRGEYLAGNNAPSLIKELRSHVIKFMDEGRIKRKEGMGLLFELSAI